MRRYVSIEQPENLQFSGPEGGEKSYNQIKIWSQGDLNMRRYVSIEQPENLQFSGPEGGEKSYNQIKIWSQGDLNPRHPD